MYCALRELFDTGGRQRACWAPHPRWRVGIMKFSGGSTMSASLEHAPLPVTEIRDDAGLGELCVLMKLGEIVLKGSNRKLFERRLHNNIRSSVRDLGDVRLSQRGAGVIILRKRDASDLEIAEIADRMSHVMGVVWVHLVRRVPKDLDAITDVAVRSMADREGTFAVRARRRDKRFEMTSSELAGRLGARIIGAHGYRVNLKHPDNTLYVEVDKDEVFVFTDGIPGQGGLPSGMSGRGLVLMSGGIDSPVAAHRMIRRGLKVHFLHFSGMPSPGRSPSTRLTAWSAGWTVTRWVLACSWCPS